MWFYILLSNNNFKKNLIQVPFLAPFLWANLKLLTPEMPLVVNVLCGFYKSIQIFCYMSTQLYLVDDAINYEIKSKPKVTRLRDTYNQSSLSSFHI